MVWEQEKRCRRGAAQLIGKRIGVIIAADLRSIQFDFFGKKRAK